VLEPGDALYLPRGTIHAAQALGETAIHLTVGVHPLTRYHLVRELLQAAQDDPELRRSLPMGVDLSDPAVIADHLAATLDALHRRIDAVPAARLAEALGADLMRRTRPVAIGPLAQLATADTLAPDTRLRLRPALRLKLDRTDGGRLRIMLLDRSIELPAGTGDAVKVAVGGPAFAVADLPGLEPDEQLVLARRLVREGVLILA
jgi:lysine-specific demethylase/histidyl-hydroxylase NO66